MKTNTYWIILIVFVTCLLEPAETRGICDLFNDVCKDGEKCGYDGYCHSSRDTYCGVSYCTKPMTCCGLASCCPADTTCCGNLFCCKADTYCDGYSCKAHSTYGTTGSFGWYYLLFIVIPIIAICAGMCRWVRYSNRGTRQQTATRTTGSRQARQGYSADRILVAYSISNPSSVATISDRTSDQLPHAFAMPPSYEEISHASPVDGANTHDVAKMPEPPSYNDVISGKVPVIDSSSGQSSDKENSADNRATSPTTCTNSSSESGGVDNMAYV